MIDPNLDPEVETQLRAFMASAAELSTATIQLDNLSLDDIVAPTTPADPEPQTTPATPQAAQPGQNPSGPRRRATETVGPSDWPDDFDDHPDSQRNWLV